MGRKYIGQRTSRNFVYPNNNLEEYDIEIVHDINNNSVSGTTTSITASSISSTGITFSFDYTWAQNSAEPFLFTVFLHNSYVMNSIGTCYAPTIAILIFAIYLLINRFLLSHN